MKVEIVTPAELGREEFSRWNQIQAVCPGLSTPFLSPHFAAACARARPQTRVGVLTSDEGISGFFPFERGRWNVGRALGHGYSDAQGLVAPETADIDFRALLAGCALRSWEFDHLLAWQRGWLVNAPHRLVAEFSPVVDVGAGWAAYERTQREVSTSLLQSTARKRRKLERDHGSVSFAFHEPDHALLDRLLRWKSDQYRRSGWRDGFADTGMRQLVHDLLDVDDPQFGGSLAVLRVGEKVVGLHMGLRYGATLAWWIPVYSPRFGNYSPGLILCLDVLRAMAGNGLSLLDLGKGDESYKRRIANAEVPLLRGAVSQDRVAARVEAARRWPQEQVVEFVLGSPSVRTRVRATLAQMGAARARWAELRGGSSRV